MPLGITVRGTKAEQRIFKDLYSPSYSKWRPFLCFVGFFAVTVKRLTHSHAILNQSTWYKRGATYI